MNIPLYQLGIRLDKVSLLRKVQVNYSSRKQGISLGQFPILDYILDHPGCTQKEIAGWLQVSPASIALSTKRLQKMGLIRKAADEENLRCNKLTATELGIQRRNQFREQMDACDEKMFRGFSEEEKEQLMQMLDRLIQNIAPEKYKELSKEVMDLMRKDLTRMLREESEGGAC